MASSLPYGVALVIWGNVMFMVFAYAPPPLMEAGMVIALLSGMVGLVVVIANLFRMVLARLNWGVA